MKTLIKKQSITALLLLGLAAGSAWAKLPPLSDEAKAKAEETKAKAAEVAKKDAEDLGKAQDRVAERHIREQKAKGVIVKPTPIAPPAALAAVASGAPAAAAAPAPAAKK